MTRHVSSPRIVVTTKRIPFAAIPITHTPASVKARAVGLGQGVAHDKLNAV